MFLQVGYIGEKMNKKQWNVMGVAFALIGMLFIRMSLQWKNMCGLMDEVTMLEIVLCIKGEIFAPYPYIFFGMAIVFMICSWLEEK